MEGDETVWYKDFTVLYKNYYELIPHMDYSREKQTNIITRVCIYIIIALLAINYTQPVFLPISILFLVNILYFIHSKDVMGRKKDIERRLNNRQTKKKISRERYEDFLSYPNYYMEADNLSPIEEEEEANDFEAGYLDFDGNPVVGPYYGVNSNKTPEEDNDLFTIHEKEQYEKATCKRPTFENPFMNHNQNDYNNNKDNIPKACNVDDDEINNEMELKFNENMFRNLDDVFDLENSKRQFYTLPAKQVPNNQKEFALWCYGTGPTCKEDQYKCLRYEDVRLKSPRIPHRIPKV